MNALRIGVACVVAIVWAVVFLASVFNPRVNTPPELSGVMLAVVTWLFGGAFREGLKERGRRIARALLEDDPAPPDPGTPTGGERDA